MAVLVQAELSLGRQKYADLWVQGQLGVYSKFHASQGYIDPVSKKTKTNQQTNKPTLYSSGL